MKSLLCFLLLFLGVLQGEEAAFAITAEEFEYQSFDNEMTGRQVVINLPDQTFLSGEMAHVFLKEAKEEGNNEKTPLSKISRLIFDGPTRFSYESGKGIVTSVGPLTIDHEKKMITISSPRVLGKVKPQDQVCFEEPSTKIFADLFRVEYVIQEGKPALKLVTLEGNVRIVTEKIRDQELRDRLEHLAIAERLDYNPLQGEMILRGSKGKRVLYLDQSKGMSVSAPRIKVKRNTQGELSFEGEGNVRLRFTDQEFDRVREEFPFIKF